METLLQSLIPKRTPQGGVVRSIGALPAIAPQAVAPVGVAPTAAPAAPQLSPTAKYIADMQALMSGGIGQLSTGEKISALGQVLQAAGSRGAADPAAVLQNVRQQQMQKLNAQYQIAQLQQAQQQAAQQRAAIEKYKVALEPDEINALEGLPLEKQAEKISEIAFRQDQVQQIKRADDGQTYILFASGKSKPAGFNLPKDYEKIDTGNGFKFVNKDDPTEFLKDASGKDLFIPQQMNAFQRESLGLRRQEIAKADARARAGGGGATNLPQPTVKIVNGKPTYVQWSKTQQKYVPFKQAGLTPPSSSVMLANQLGPKAEALLAQGLNVE
jgi:hypothetical protein